MREQAAADEMPIAQRFLQRRHDGGAAIRGGKDRPPFLRGFPGDDFCHGSLGCLRIAAVVHDLARKADRGRECEPEFLFQRSASHKLCVLGRVELVAR